MFLMQISTFLSRGEGNLKVSKRSYTIPFGTEETRYKTSRDVTDQIQTDSPNQRS
jgi:hypothetical protein